MCFFFETKNRRRWRGGGETPHPLSNTPPPPGGQECQSKIPIFGRNRFLLSVADKDFGRFRRRINMGGPHISNPRFILLQVRRPMAASLARWGGQEIPPEKFRFFLKTKKSAPLARRQWIFSHPAP